MRLGLVDGPGHHGPTMTAQLVALGHEVVATHAVPHFSVVEHRPCRVMGTPHVRHTDGL